MTQDLATPPVADAAADTAAPAMVATRFGPIAVEPGRAIIFKDGLLGFSHRGNFVLTDVPERSVPFKLLQAIDDPDLGFLVLPLDAEAGPIARDDLEAACRHLGLDWPALAVLAIVTLRAEPGGLVCTANLRAPLLIDTGRRLGCQHVLASDAYAIRHMVDLGRRDGR